MRSLARQARPAGVLAEFAADRHSSSAAASSRFPTETTRHQDSDPGATLSIALGCRHPAVSLLVVTTFTGRIFFAWVRSRHQQNISSAVLVAHIGILGGH
jgi:hypothetical protein